jgi:RNA polymerase sigma factor (sigma-70 family)
MTPQLDDATLAVAAASGDSAALGLIYDRYGSRLLGLCVSVLRSRADAEDCLQDVFVLAATRLRELREPQLLRSWLFAVARHECLARLDRRRREVSVDELPDLAASGADLPAAAVLDAELAALLRDAADGLSDRDRLLLELAHRQELSGDELARAIGVPRSTAYTLVDRARGTAVRSIGALLVARANRGQCGTLDGILSGWDGKLTTLHRKQIARHIDGCEVCDTRRRRLATPAALLGEGQAAVAGFLALRPRILAAAGQARRAQQAALPGGATPGGTSAAARADRMYGGNSGGGANNPHEPDFSHARSGGSTEHWIDGWPPAYDYPAEPDQDRPLRRLRKPVMLLIVLLILLLTGTVAGALAYQARHKQPASSFTGSLSSTTQMTPPATVTVHPLPASTPTASATQTAPTRTPPPTATTRSKPTQTATPTLTPTTNTTPPATIFILTVYTGHEAVTVTINGATSTCLPGHIQTPCTYSVADRGTVAVTAPDDGYTFSAPAACTSTGPDCDFVMTANTAVRLTGS